MINKDPGEGIKMREKRKMRNHYADLWALFFVILYIVGCYIFFNTLNPFTATWGYFRITSNAETQVKLDKNTTMIRQNVRANYLQSLVHDLEIGGFNITERQTHILKVEKAGLEYTYTFKEKSLLGGKYTLVIRKEGIE